jgi:adenosylcobinamide-GDP ribazoletransferase
VALTGALHLDGLADCCDGLFLAASRERRLEVMADPHTGAFGVIGLVLILLLKAAALTALARTDGAALPFAAALARWCILPAARLPAARPGGMGADFASGLQPWALYAGALAPAGLMLLLGVPGLAALLAGLGAASLAALLARARIGGVTGDVFGAIVETVETAVLLAVAGMR